MHGFRISLCVVAALTVSACQTAREQEAAVKPEVAQAYLADKPAGLQKHLYVSLAQGKRNQVLNDMRIGLAAMEMGETALAETLLDDALQQIEAVYANNEDAAKARELFTKEAVKDFKGEPYERAMAYYYRGLLYLKKGDFDNARASFLAGFNQDAMSEEEQYQADFGLLQYLQGWASRCRGNVTTADEDFKAFKTIPNRENFPLPAAGDNTVILVETGSSPIKLSVGDQNNSKPRYLQIKRSSVTETARIILPPPPTVPVAPTKGKAVDAKAKGKAEAPPPPVTASTTVQMPLLEDVYFQASTRGGRAFDSILNGKAQFKSASDTVGDVALVGALAASQIAMSSSNARTQRDAGGAAAALLLMALVAKGASEATEAAADTRYWDTLPDRIYAISANLGPDISSLPVEFLDKQGEVIRSKQVQVVRSGPCGLAWVRGLSAVPSSPRAPNSAPAEVMRKPVVIPAVPAPSETTKTTGASDASGQPTSDKKDVTP